LSFAKQINSLGDLKNMYST